MYTNIEVKRLFFYFFSLVSRKKMNYTKELWDVLNISYILDIE